MSHLLEKCVATLVKECFVTKNKVRQITPKLKDAVAQESALKFRNIQHIKHDM